MHVVVIVIITYNMHVVNSFFEKSGKMFNKRLRQARMARKLTQQVLADKVGVALRSYQCYEQGVREPSLALLVALADVLEVPTDYLLCRDLERVKSFDGYR